MAGVLTRVLPQEAALSGSIAKTLLCDLSRCRTTLGHCLRLGAES